MIGEGASRGQEGKVRLLLHPRHGPDDSCWGLARALAVALAHALDVDVAGSGNWNWAARQVSHLNYKRKINKFSNVGFYNSLHNTLRK